MPKFWILFLNLAKMEKRTLENGLADLAIYSVENSYDNRILLADFLPEGLDEEEEQADAILLEKWQEHINNTIYDHGEETDQVPAEGTASMLAREDLITSELVSKMEGNQEAQNLDETMLVVGPYQQPDDGLI